MKPYLNKLCIGLAVAALNLPLSAAAATYTLTSPGTDQVAWVNGGQFEIGRFSLQSTVGDILGLNTSVTLMDQGWGGQDPTNGVYVGLFAGETALYTLHVAGANHSWKTDNYSLTANQGDFAGLNAALDSAQWNAGVTVRMYTNAWDYQGWQLHTRNVSLDMTSGVMAPVPEPASYAMLLGGLTLLGAAARRRQGRAVS
ncbi:PEP-CTERM sorting domain-containing protein [Massilia atriviolacea]|uniref:PEP-CTERM sorting domain-containing protein n=1 Tax=Massilia atriviolacea TaxID=2495579 RepID=A0A430HTY0_9BURK|nr:PEP-CTERM sorting domain-containing protein [Massilia atriviolacea]RSZ60834.1 PEP-CTERM sorting domain-containing protein [Massilia atriviolacea]